MSNLKDAMNDPDAIQRALVDSHKTMSELTEIDELQERSERIIRSLFNTAKGLAEKRGIPVITLEQGKKIMRSLIQEAHLEGQLYELRGTPTHADDSYRRDRATELEQELEKL